MSGCYQPRGKIAIPELLKTNFRRGVYEGRLFLALQRLGQAQRIGVLGVLAVGLHGLCRALSLAGFGTLFGRCAKSMFLWRHAPCFVDGSFTGRFNMSPRRASS